SFRMEAARMRGTPLCSIAKHRTGAVTSSTRTGAVWDAMGAGEGSAAGRISSDGAVTDGAAPAEREARIVSPAGEGRDGPRRVRGRGKGGGLRARRALRSSPGSTG